MSDWDNLVEPARGALEALLRKGDEMANRIEELEELNQAMTKKVHKLTTLLDDQFGTPCEQIRHTQEVEELEAKLAKAVEAIEEMQTASDAMMLHIARTTLAELKGQNYE